VSTSASRCIRMENRCGCPHLRKVSLDKKILERSTATYLRINFARSKKRLKMQDRSS
jgi:hypothetical protein